MKIVLSIVSIVLIMSWISPDYIEYKANEEIKEKARIKAIPDPVITPWKCIASTDPMNGKKFTFTTSPTVVPSTQMDFPYKDVNVYASVGSDGSTDLQFNKLPVLSNGETQDGYNVYTVTIKWNDDVNQVEDVKVHQFWGSDRLSFVSRHIANKIKTSNKLTVQISPYGHNLSYFNIPLKGSTKAINSMKTFCK